MFYTLRNTCCFFDLVGLSNLTTLSFKRNNLITARGISSLSGLINLKKLDLERCPRIHGGLAHLKGLYIVNSF